MKYFLFDMDGTLTLPRGKMMIDMCKALHKLQCQGFKIGIVTGSDINYIVEQCQIILDIPGLDFQMLDIFPCNGTKHYKIGIHGNPVIEYENKMKDFLLPGRYQKLVYELLLLLSESISNPDLVDIMPLTGNFINCRGSMINFSPIGRNANQKERSTWISLDNKFGIRKMMLKRLKNSFPQQDISFKYGGDTSIDIFPKGWDKTFVLRNFKDSDEIWFVGDRCQKLGNDKELYDAIKLRDSGESFETSCPSKTIEIINKINHQYSG